LLKDSTDRSGIGLSDDEHEPSMGIGTATGKQLLNLKVRQSGA
jgi:hypothetical protein